MLRQQFAHDLAVDVGEAEVAAGVAEGEALVVEAEEVEDGRLQVVDVDGIHLGFEAELVRRAIDRATSTLRLRPSAHLGHWHT